MGTTSQPCPFTQGTGTVDVQISARPVQTAGPASPNFEHVYVTLTGIEAMPMGVAGGDAPSWQELAPELATHPAQVDLLARAGESCAAHLTMTRGIPADVYTEIQLRIAGSAAAGGDAAMQEENACGGAGLNCVVTPRGEALPVIFDGNGRNLIIGREQLSGGVFRVIPGERNYLSIGFNPYASTAVPSGASVKIVPVFSAATDASCNSPEPQQNPEN
ncbi:MAG TPA: DUF4382 domain-containing protein [Verrucomicrobiae bacterium]|nr:DUF4382 domain-containing protein [Verrucomicrobiae bacterium]